MSTSDLPIILSEIRSAENRLREDIQQLRNDINGVKIETSRHDEEIKRLKGQLVGLWRKIKPTTTRGEYAGKPNLWFSLVEMLGAEPKLWHFVFLIGSALAGILIKKADVLLAILK